MHNIKSLDINVDQENKVVMIIVKNKEKTYIVIIYWWLSIVDFNVLKTGIFLWLIAVSDLATLSVIISVTCCVIPSS